MVAIYVPVSIVCGAAPFIISMNFSNAHLKSSLVSVVSSNPPNMIVWKWLFTLTNSPNGKLYKFVLYVVSKVTTIDLNALAQPFVPEH